MCILGVQIDTQDTAQINAWSLSSDYHWTAHGSIASIYETSKLAVCTQAGRCIGHSDLELVFVSLDKNTNGLSHKGWTIVFEIIDMSGSNTCAMVASFLLNNFLVECSDSLLDEIPDDSKAKFKARAVWCKHEDYEAFDITNTQATKFLRVA